MIRALCAGLGEFEEALAEPPVLVLGPGPEQVNQRVTFLRELPSYRYAVCRTGVTAFPSDSDEERQRKWAYQAAYYAANREKLLAQRAA